MVLDEARATEREDECSACVQARAHASARAGVERGEGGAHKPQAASVLNEGEVAISTIFRPIVRTQHGIKGVGQRQIPLPHLVAHTTHSLHI